MSIDKFLKKLHACSPAREWANNKSWEEIYTTSYRGDWMLWLYKKVNPDDLQRLTLAKGHCANDRIDYWNDILTELKQM